MQRKFKVNNMKVRRYGKRGNNIELYTFIQEN